MKVRDLIALLQEENPNTEVFVATTTHCTLVHGVLKAKDGYLLLGERKRGLHDPFHHREAKKLTEEKKKERAHLGDRATQECPQGESLLDAYLNGKLNGLLVPWVQEKLDQGFSIEWIAEVFAEVVLFETPETGPRRLLLETMPAAIEAIAQAWITQAVKENAPETT